MLAGAAVEARLVRTAVVEVLVAEDASPVEVADALPGGVVAVAVPTPRVGSAVVAELGPPSGTAGALAGTFAEAVHGMATLLADGGLAGATAPSRAAHLATLGGAAVMAEPVVAWLAQVPATGSVVVGRARHPDPVGQLRPPARMTQRVPFLAGQH